MATENPKKTTGQGAGAPQQEAVEAITALFQEAMKQMGEARQPTLGDEAQKAVDAYKIIARALAVPKIDSPLADDQKWNLPELNETARPDDQTPAGGAS